jgi:glycosyltransferase involved in cell wall biosynthesis
VLVHPSLMEGGANVIVEAVTAGTPVLASRVSGNLGMLGRNYPGYFEVGDAAGLAALLVSCIEDGRLLPRLREHCSERARLFTPARERQALRRLVAEVIAGGQG